MFLRNVKFQASVTSVLDFVIRRRKPECWDNGYRNWSNASKWCNKAITLAWLTIFTLHLQPNYYFKWLDVTLNIVLDIKLSFQIKWQYKVKRKRNQGCDFNLTVKVVDAGTRRVLFFTSSSKKEVRIRPSRATALPKKQTLKTKNRRKVKKKKGKNKKRTRKNRHRNKENWKMVEPSIAPNTFLVTTCVQ